MRGFPHLRRRLLHCSVSPEEASYEREIKREDTRYGQNALRLAGLLHPISSDIAQALGLFLMDGVLLLKLFSKSACFAEV